MRIKKFIASSLKEGKAQIIKELGEDAVILSSRTARNPNTDVDFVEIVAAIDDNPLKSEKTRFKLPVSDKTPPVQTESTGISGDGESHFLEASAQIYREIGSMKDMLIDISDNIKYKYSGILGQIYGQIYKAIRKADFSDEYALKIAGSLLKQGTIKNLDDGIKAARALITRDLVILPPIQKSKERKVAIFIGTTGSGKTTVLVKLAIICKMILNSDVLVVSADTLKVGGSDQLQTFASIAGIPFHSVFSPYELQEVIEKEIKKDFIFIDTVGRSQKNKANLNDIGDFVRASKADFNFLVQSSTVSESTFTEVLKVFSVFNPSALILTKLDEAATFGGVVSALLKNPLPVSYLTNGQRVPEDIEPAGKERFGELILPDSYKFEV